VQKAYSEENTVYNVLNHLGRVNHSQRREPERKADKDDTEELQHQKIQSCLQIIDTYNLITAKCVEEGLPATEVQRMLFKSMPDLGQILNDIAASETGSNWSSVMQNSVDDSEDGCNNMDSDSD
jgi:hypothetical protein